MVSRAQWSSTELLKLVGQVTCSEGLVYEFVCVVAPSGTPRNLTLLDGSPTSNRLSVQWLPLSEDEANGIVLSYHVILWNMTNMEKEKKVPSTDGFVHFTELEPWMEYTVSVAAETKGGIGPYTNLTVATKEAGNINVH